MIMNKENRLHSSRGFALVMTLWVLAILSSLLITFALSVNLSVKNAAYLKDSVYGKEIAKAAINRINASLVYPKDRNKAKDDKSKKKGDDSSSSSSKSSSNNSSSSSGSNSSNSRDNNDSKQSEKSEKDKEEDIKRAEWYYKALGKWYVYLKDWRAVRDRDASSSLDEYVVCNIYAEDSKFDVKSINKVKSFDKYSDTILENIKEKFKKDKKYKITCVQQLLTIDGVKGENFDGDGRDMKGLRNILTAFSNGKVYVNKANAGALELVPGLDSSAARSIAEYDDLIYDSDKLKEVMGMISGNSKKTVKKWLQFIPEYFRIKAKYYSNGMSESAEAVVKIKDGEFSIVSLK